MLGPPARFKGCWTYCTKKDSCRCGKIFFESQAAQAISLKKSKQDKEGSKAAKKVELLLSSCEIGVVRYWKCSANIDKKTKKEHRAILAELQQN